MPCITFVKRQYYSKMNQKENQSRNQESRIFSDTAIFVSHLSSKNYCSGSFAPEFKDILANPKSDNQDKNWKKRNNRENFTVTTVLSYTYGVNEFIFTCNHYKWFYLSMTICQRNPVCCVIGPTRLSKISIERLFFKAHIKLVR